MFRFNHFFGQLTYVWKLTRTYFSIFVARQQRKRECGPLRPLLSSANVVSLWYGWQDSQSTTTSRVGFRTLRSHFSSPHLKKWSGRSLRSISLETVKVLTKHLLACNHPRCPLLSTRPVQLPPKTALDSRRLPVPIRQTLLSRPLGFRFYCEALCNNW